MCHRELLYLLLGKGRGCDIVFSGQCIVCVNLKAVLGDSLSVLLFGKPNVELSLNPLYIYSFLFVILFKCTNINVRLYIYNMRYVESQACFRFLLTVSNFFF